MLKKKTVKNLIFPNFLHIFAKIDHHEKDKDH